MAKRTKEEIQAQVAEASAARREKYFGAQAEAKTAAAAKLTELPVPDAYVYTDVWRQGAGTSGGYFSRVRTPNPNWDPNQQVSYGPGGQIIQRGFSTNPTAIAFPNGLPSRPGKTVTSVTRNVTGNISIRYSDGTTEIVSGGTVVDPTKVDTKGKTETGRTTNADGSTIITYSDGSSTVIPATTNKIGVTGANGNSFGNLTEYNNSLAQNAANAAATAERKSAYDLLYQQFAKYGLQSLVAPLEGLIKEGIPASEFAIRLRETDAYKKRFAANAQRINKGLAALSEAEYIGLEDAYQNIMRQYGMPESYYARGELGKQEGFEKFIAGDVSPAELETRISTAYNRVINSNPEVVAALKQYYPSITNGDILAYALDPNKALTDINKKVTAAEIGAAAMGAGLAVDVARAEQLGAFGVNKAQAQQGYQTIADILPSATKLSNIYQKQGLGPYNQAVAEQEVFGISGAADAAAKRRQLAQLETAQFSGQTGVGALARERAGQF